MKKAMKWILPILLISLLIGSAGWYMFVYDRATVQDFLTAQARNCAKAGNFDAATWFYNQSYKLSDKDENVAIELADIYKSVGNYTKAESTLTKAVADGGTAELYIALCRTFVEQDKLLDAVTMLDNVSDPAIKAELDQLRPAAPLADHEPGFYNQYINLSFTQGDGTLYVTTDGQYPSTSDAPYSAPIILPAGETRIYALSVGQNGLVSPVSILSYTVAGVIEEVTLSDPAIDSDVRTTLMFGADTAIYTSDLWSISEYEVPAEAVSVEDLQYMTQLKKLTISEKEIGSLAFLSGMTQLEELRLINCSLPDEIDTIAALPALKSLTLSGCNLSTISRLTNAVGLTYLDVSSNAIGDISILSAMPQLSVLNLSHNAVTDLTPLSSLTQLTELDVSYNSVNSIAPVGICVGLKKLNITNNSVSDLSAISALKGLTHFYAGYNSLNDVSVLATCTELQELDISNNALTDISGLSTLVKLTHFNFSYNDVTVLPAFPKDCALVQINGEHNLMEDISALGGMENLNLVYMDYNNISDISFLADCPLLEQVNVYGTSVSEVQALLDHSIIVNYDPT